MVGVTPTAHRVKRNLHIMQYDNERVGVNCPAIFHIPPKAYISVQIGVSPNPETVKQMFNDAFGTQSADFYERPNGATEKAYARQ